MGTYTNNLDIFQFAGSPPSVTLDIECGITADTLYIQLMDKTNNQHKILTTEYIDLVDLGIAIDSAMSKKYEDEEKLQETPV